MYKFKKPSNPENKHYFASEELLVPRANNCDTQRLNMFSGHITQLVHLRHAEPPKVFTNFENAVGEYSISYRKADKNYTIVDKIIKNKFNYTLILKDENNVYDICHIKKAACITEDYGYEILDQVKEKKIGDKVRSGDNFYSCSLYDENENFSYGVNLNTAFLAHSGMTYEDSIIISESAAKKLESYKVEEVYVSLNKNDILINLYGDSELYRSLPKIGEKLYERILCARRRIDYKNSLYDLKNKELMKIDSLNDEILYSVGGVLVDIDIYSNTPAEEMNSNLFNKEIIGILTDQDKYYMRLNEALKRIVLNEKQYTDDLGYWFKFTNEYIDDEIKWKYNGNAYDHILMKLTILKNHPVSVGTKITARYGNKGVISQILPDSEMMVDNHGKRIEMYANPLAIINRLIPAPLYEIFINHMSDNLLAHIKDMNTDEKYKHIIEYIELLNSKQSDFIKNTLRESEKEEFVQSLYEKGIHIHQPPFFDNTSFDTFLEIFKNYPHLKLKKILTDPNISNKIQMVTGDLYHIRLKHEGDNKLSTRSTSQINTKNIPAKSQEKKKHKAIYNDNPIRLGEMEITNLLLSKDSSVVSKLLKSYATSEEDRLNLINNILDANDPLKIKVETIDKPSINRNILNKNLLYILGLQLEDGEETTDYVVNKDIDFTDFDIDDLEDLELNLFDDDDLELFNELGDDNESSE